MPTSLLKPAAVLAGFSVLVVAGIVAAGVATPVPSNIAPPEASAPGRAPGEVAFNVVRPPNGTLLLAIEVNVSSGANGTLTVPAGGAIDVDQLIVSNGTFLSGDSIGGGIFFVTSYGGFAPLLAIPSEFGTNSIEFSRPIRLDAGDTLRWQAKQGGTSAYWDITLVGRPAVTTSGLVLN